MSRASEFPPIFIVGAGRSGSTVFHRVVAEHPHVAWLSSLCERFPARPALNRRLMQALDLPGVGRLLMERLEPGEVYAFWDHHYRGFSVPFRDLLRNDVTESARQSLCAAFSAMATVRRPGLLIKITGWPRVGFLREVFPNARFIHVVRDGRAVANSLLHVDWWWGWRGPWNWRWGPLPDALADLWNRHDQSFIALAAIQWKILVDAVATCRQDLPADQFHEIRYEEFCSDPVNQCRRAIEFAGLEWTPGFEASVRRAKIRSENERWRRDLTADQQRQIESVIGADLERLGYLPGPALAP